CDDFMLGRDILVASVVEAGQRQRRVWLPDNKTGWYDFYNGEWFCGGQWITIDAPLEKLPLLVRAGAGIPLSERITYVSEAEDNHRKLKLFPIKGTGKSTGLLFEDDGETWGYTEGNALWLEWELDCTATTIELRINTHGDYRPAWETLKVIIPQGESRQLLINGIEAYEWNMNLSCND
ncbi:TPA: DUF5110 domain-containing protein, partial [Escherichia coli]|nr:DUF5110 domain-containing protein [Escherichia coli]